MVRPGSLTADVPEEVLYQKESDDGLSDCSTVSGLQAGDVRDGEDRHSGCYSVSGPEVESLIIFDWDDTLLPTTWIHQSGLLLPGMMPSTEQCAQLGTLSESAWMTLQTAIQMGKVVIITNAEQGWIEKSCTMFMPSLVKLLKTLDIVSARSTYKQISQEPSEWKQLAFEYEVGLFYGANLSGQRRNIVSIGDSLHEVLALKAIAAKPDCCGKSVKFLEAPSIEQLIDQHEHLSTCLLDIVEHNGNMDVEMGAEFSEQVHT